MLWRLSRIYDAAGRLACFEGTAAYAFASGAFQNADTLSDGFRGCGRRSGFFDFGDER